MRAMEEKILAEGKVLPGQILKVGSFLNQQIDVPFLTACAAWLAGRFADAGITKVMTIESSGISLAVLIAQALGVRTLVVKKGTAANVSGSVYTAEIDSFTHGNRYTAVLSRDYLSAGDVVLLADDFLACGNALLGMKSMAEAAGARVAGCAIAVEKGFQGGGDRLRAQGIRVESLAIVDAMTDETITFRQN
ncbi:MAG: xanthine phosphoribosyltransferase [Lachnospiraceae bacterium]|nr:xanthine phosphoribosyltransferase [Lachnospiraceae bacterium]